MRRRLKQTTLKKEIKLEGTSAQGRPAIVKLKPAAENTGIVFVKGKHRIPVNFFNIRLKTLPYRTVMLRDPESKTEILTVEHILGAVNAMGLHNAEIEMVRGDALPCFTDAIAPYVEGIESAGLQEQQAERTDLRVNMDAAGDMLMKGRDVNKKLEEAKVQGVRFGDDEDLVMVQHPKRGDMLVLRPTDGAPKVTYHFDYPHRAFGGPQTYTWTRGDIKSFKSDIMHARAPAFYPHKRYLQKAMNFLGRRGWHGMTEHNTLIVGHPDNPEFLNPPGETTGVRYAGLEGGRHKIIDALGEMAFLPGQPQADMFFIKTGHKTSAEFMEKLLRKGILVPQG